MNNIFMEITKTLLQGQSGSVIVGEYADLKNLDFQNGSQLWKEIWIGGWTSCKSFLTTQDIVLIDVTIVFHVATTVFDAHTWIIVFEKMTISVKIWPPTVRVYVRRPDRSSKLGR